MSAPTFVFGTEGERAGVQSHGPWAFEDEMSVSDHVNALFVCCVSWVAQATEIPPPTKAVLPLSSGRRNPSFAPKAVVLDIKEWVELEYSTYPLNRLLGMKPRWGIVKLEDGDKPSFDPILYPHYPSSTLPAQKHTRHAYVPKLPGSSTSEKATKFNFRRHPSSSTAQYALASSDEME
ncbi:hypothetical protein BDQ17DRAFT_1336934 [Cyathus striatus]|nr:hypothetical protein BDQ17DRAFT_1336934 [Cyathus striatus]